MFKIFKNNMIKKWTSNIDISIWLLVVWILTILALITYIFFNEIVLDVYHYVKFTIK